MRAFQFLDCVITESQATKMNSESHLLLRSWTSGGKILIPIHPCPKVKKSFLCFFYNTSPKMSRGRLCLSSGGRTGSGGLGSTSLRPISVDGTTDPPAQTGDVWLLSPPDPTPINDKAKLTFLPVPSWVSPGVPSLSSLFSFHRWGHWEPCEISLALPFPTGSSNRLCLLLASSPGLLLTYRIQKQALSTHLHHSEPSPLALWYVLFYGGTGNDLVKVADDLPVATSEGLKSVVTWLFWLVY